MPAIAKPLRGFGSGVLELVLAFRGDAYRVVYAVQLGADVWVIHAFQKKSKMGIRTPKQEIDLIEARLGRSEDPTESAELRLKLADVYESQLQDLPAAIHQFQEVLHGEKLWERGVHALERLVIHDDHRARVIELLEPVYRAQDWWQKLVVVLDAKLDQPAARLNAGAREVPRLGLVEGLGPPQPVGDLDGGVPVALWCLDLHDAHRGDLHQGHGHGAVALVPDLGHADLLTHDRLGSHFLLPCTRTLRREKSQRSVDSVLPWGLRERTPTDIS